MNYKYRDYFKAYYNYKQANEELNKIQNEIVDIINCMLSTTSTIKEVATSTKSTNDKLTELTARKIELEEQQCLKIKILDIRVEQLRDTEKQLRNSKETKDIIYYKYFIQHLKVIDIAKSINFVSGYVYQLLREIKEDTSKIEKEIKEKNQKK